MMMKQTKKLDGSEMEKVFSTQTKGSHCWTNMSRFGWVLLVGVCSVCLCKHPRCVHLSVGGLGHGVMDAAKLHP